MYVDELYTILICFKVIIEVKQYEGSWDTALSLRWTVGSLFKSNMSFNGDPTLPFLIHRLR